MLRASASHRREYERRVNRVMDYVQAHLADELGLEKLASVAAFSPFHFHRVFAAITGETVSDFIRRIRIERAASHLVLLRETPVIEIALRCGFSSAAVFARAFRAHFGMSATDWRDGGALRWGAARRGAARRGKNSNLRKASSNRREASPPKARHGSAMEIEIRRLAPCRVAYVRHVGPYGDDGRIGELWRDFERWIRANGLRQPGTLTIGIGHDAPRIAAADKLRYDACLVVDADFKPDRFVNMADLPGGKYAVTQFEGPTSAIGQAWERMFTDWLPGSGYKPDERPCIELRQDFETLESPGRVRCEFCLPIEPL